MAAHPDSLTDVRVLDRERWLDGPPHELFKELRASCPVHWTSEIREFPTEKGFWSVTRPDDIATVSRDWATYSSEVGGVTAISESIFPMELSRAMFIGMDPPKHDRVKQLFQKGFTPKRIAEHEEAIRAIVVPLLDRLEGREEAELVSEVAQPVVARVIGSFMGIPESDDATWARLMNNLLGAGARDLDPSEIPAAIQQDIGELFQRCQSLINERRERPTDALPSVLGRGEGDGQTLEEHEIVMGFFLLMAAGNDSPKATY